MKHLEISNIHSFKKKQQQKKTKSPAICIVTYFSSTALLPLGLEKSPNNV